MGLNKLYPVLGLLTLIVSACSNQAIKGVEDPRFQNKIKQAPYVAVPFNKQLNRSSCGAAVLSSVLQYWDRKVSQQEILQISPPKSKMGYTLGELKHFALEQDMRAFAFNGSFQQIKAQIYKGRPTIVLLHVNSKYIGLDKQFADLLRGGRREYSHYAVVIGVQGRRIWLMDPVLGVKSVKRSLFQKMWAKSQNAMLLVAR